MDPYWTIGKITNRIDEQWDLVLDSCIRICPRIGHNFRRTVRETRPIRISPMMRVVISSAHVQTALNSVHRFMSSCIFAIVRPCGLGLCLCGVLPTKKPKIRSRLIANHARGKCHNDLTIMYEMYPL